MEVGSVAPDSSLSVVSPPAARVASAAIGATGSDTPAAQDSTPSTVVTLSSAEQPDIDQADGQPSNAKSFTYGLLGLGKPKTDAEIEAETPAEKSSDDLYSTGRLIIDGMAIGAMISLFA
jgi:hypothetical protein